MPEKNGRTDNLTEALRSMIGSETFPPGSRLPAIRDLANDFAVSKTTVSRAMDKLSTEGLVKRFAGSGIYVNPMEGEHHPRPSNVPPPTKRRSVRVAEEIMENISLGGWKVGEILPSIKVLRHQMQTSPQTLRKIFHELEGQKKVHRQGNHWVVGPAPRRGTGPAKRVYALTGGDPSLAGRNRQTIWSDLLLTIERELANFGAHLYANLGPKDPNRLPARELAKKNTLGFFFFGYNEGWARSQNNDSTRLTRDMHWISGLGLPTIVFNCAPILGCFPKFSFRPFRHVFPLGVDNVGAASETTRYVVARGHRRIAFFSYSADFWNEQRYQGVLAAMEPHSDQGGQVIPFQAGFQKEMLGIASEIDMGRLEAHLKEVIREVHPQHKNCEVQSWNEILQPIHKLVINDHMNITMKPFFEQALDVRSITAWITADPSIALSAARFLRSQKVSIPKEISIASIDDGRPLSLAGITASNMQMERMGYLAAHCLLGDIPIKRDRKGLVVCPPRMIERGSVVRV